MISVGKATSAEYYTTGGGVAGGFESYYLDAVTEGEPPGVWSGRMAAALGLEGEVDARVMEQVFGRFEHPETGEPLGSRQQKWRSVDERLEAALAKEPGALPERVAQLRADIERQVRTTVLGWDATFNVPKSVTVAHTALYRAEIAAVRSGNTVRAAELGAVRRGIESAILDANTAAVAYLESLAVSRTGGGSGTAAQWIAADQVTVASFFQHTNRSIDPHLHVHNVVVNRAICADGKIRSLDGEDLLAQKFAFSAVADRTMFEGLARLGLDSVARTDGLGRELVAVPADAIEHFSTRRARITAALAPLVEAAEEAKGRPLTDWETYKLKQTVTLATRAAKDHTRWSHEELLAIWNTSLASEAGQTLDGLADVVMADAVRGPVTGPALEDWSPTAVIAEAVAACADRSATWGRANLISELELRLPILGIDTDEVVPLLERLADAALESEHVVAVTGHTPDLDLGTARLAASAPSARRYAATGTLAAEIALREAALTRSGTRFDPAEVAAWLDTHTPTLGADQRAAVLGLAGGDAAISVLVGPAGTGKSYTAGTLAAAWTHLTTADPNQPGQPGGPNQPGRVLGVAVSQIATTVLVDDGLPHAANVAAFLAAQDRLDAGSTNPGDRTWQLRPTDIVLVDEASMVATTDLDRIRRRVQAAGARMILAGDPRQLAAVQAGGALDVLDGHANTYTLSEVRRFHADWERAASLALRDAPTTTDGTEATSGGAVDALAVYDRHGRLLEHATVEAALEAAARAAVADRLDGRTTVVVTGTNDQAAATAMRIRDTLVRLGHVEAAGVHLGRDGCTAGVGDVIACRRNDYTLGVTNRQQYTVHAVGPDGSLTVAPLPAPGHSGAAPAGTLIDLPAQYVADDVQLGYASTVHAAQGITVDTAHLVTDGALDPAGIYVALTRGRTRNTAHVAVTVDSTDHPDRGPLPEATTDRGGATVLTGTSTRASARSVLAAAWNRNTGSPSAVVTAETDHARRTTATAIMSDLETHTRIACRARMDNHLDDLVADGVLHPDTRARLATDQASEHLSRLLRAVEQTGADPRTALHDALTEGIRPHHTTTPDTGGTGRSDRRGRSSRAARAATARTSPGANPTGSSGPGAGDTATADAVAAAFADAHSIAQVLSHRITTRSLRPQPSADASRSASPALDSTAVDRAALVPMPAGLHPDEQARLHQLHAALEDRAAHLGAQLAQDPPLWALLTLGPVPTPDHPDTGTETDQLDADRLEVDHATARPRSGPAAGARGVDAEADRADWEHRAGIAALHREAVGWTHPEHALPWMPGVSASERRATYSAAWTALGRPANRLDETEMTEGRLRARVTAWQREQQWAPPHADAALKDASQAAERARQAAVLADAEGRHHDATALRAEADVQTALATTYDKVARARTSWAERTHATRINAHNALEELTRRGITIGDEPDRRTTRQHLDDQVEDDRARTDTAQLDDAQTDETRLDEDGIDVRGDEVHPDRAQTADNADTEQLKETGTRADRNAPVDEHQVDEEHRVVDEADVRDVHPADEQWNARTAPPALDEVAVLDIDPTTLDSTTAGPQRPARAGRPALEVIDPTPAREIGADTLNALAATAEAAARIAADQISQDEAYAARAQAETDQAIAEAGRRRNAAVEDAADDTDDWDRASTDLNDAEDANGVVDDGYGNDPRYTQRYDTDSRYTPDHTTDTSTGAGADFGAQP